LTGGRASSLNYHYKQRTDAVLPDRRAENTLFPGYGSSRHVDIVAMVTQRLSIRDRGPRAA